MRGDRAPGRRIEVLPKQARLPNADNRAFVHRRIDVQVARADLLQFLKCAIQAAIDCRLQTVALM